MSDTAKETPFLEVPNTTSDLLGHKLRLLEKLVDALERALEGEVNNRQRELRKIRDLKVRAIIAREHGESALAGRLLDEAIAMVSRLKRTSATASGDETTLERRYHLLAENVTSFRDALIAAERGGNDIPSGADVAEIDSLIHQAAEAAGRRRFIFANRLLTSAYQLSVAGIARRRANETIYYRLEFETTEDEYRYEQKRYLSHELLVQMMLGAQPLTEEQSQAIDMLVISAAKLHDEAGAQWRRAEYRQAIASENAAIEMLVKVLQQAGLYMPR